MSNNMPIYSQVVPKSQHRAKNKQSPREKNLARTDFDPLNYNHGGNFQILNAPLEVRMEKNREERLDRREERREERNERREERERREEKREARRKDDTSRSRKAQKNESSEGKVEAYLRQNQVNIRQQQRHSVRQAEHRLNLRSLPLNEVREPTRGHDRTPTDKHRAFPGERESGRERRRERERERDIDDFDTTPLSPTSRQDKLPSNRLRKSSSAQRVSEPAITTDKRRFFCREWLFQKIAHCLEQRARGKPAGAIILGDAGSGKTAICQELSCPGQGPTARQQRALHRRLLARHMLQSQNEGSLRPGELIRSFAMQILSHGSRKLHPDSFAEEHANRVDSEEEKLLSRLRDMGAEDGEESSKPLLADSEDQRTDEEECGGRGGGRRTIHRIHERETYQDSMLSTATDLPEILPRATKPTNPFLTEDQPKDNTDSRLYENHENLFLRNVSQRQSKELRNSRLVRQSSEPLTDRKPTMLQKSLSTEQRCDEDKKIENSPPKSRIPVANFRYPNKSDLKLSSSESSPQKKQENQQENDTKTKTDVLETSTENQDGGSNMADDALPEYQNILKPDLKLDEEAEKKIELEILLEKKRSENSDVPPPIPSLPVSPKTLIANAYYEKLLSDPEIQQALLPQNLEKDPDECFKKALLFPLLDIEPPKQCLFLLVDAIDEGLKGQPQESSGPSTSIAALLSRHQQLLPPWLLLVCTARKHCRPLTNMFAGFRRITLDELQRAHVSADVQRYVLARLDTEPRLRARVSGDSSAAAAAAAALDHLRIKSDGCLLYLEKVLDGVADGFIALREIREIPGTLNGLYLWLAQRLFHGRRFTKVRLLLDVLLAARCGVTEEILYKCLLTKEYSVTRQELNRRLHLLRRILVIDRSTGYLSIFHSSFAVWLVDVKHCTRRYLCSVSDGHAALAMYYTLLANTHRLSAMEIHHYVYHMTQLEQHLAAQKKNKPEDENEVLDLHTIILLWVLDSGCDIESALKRDDARLVDVEDKQLDTQADEKREDEESDGKDSFSEERLPIEKIMPELAGDSSTWERDTKALQALLQLKTEVKQQPTSVAEAPVTEETTEDAVEDKSEEVDLDPNMIFELATRGDEDTLALLLKRYPTLIEATDGSGGTALHCAARAGRHNICALLLQAGSRKDAPDHDGWSPLRAAAWAGHTEVVDVLLEFGCDVDCVDADNRTALRAAAWSGHSAVVRRLLCAGAAAKRADKEGRTPLMAAAYMGHRDIVRALLDAGADVNHADADGRTALSVASLCASGAACAALLLERGADVSKADRDMATPLLVAAFEGHTEICELLLEAEADIEAVDSSGRTALWAAAAAGHAPTVRLLLFWGACVDNMDPEGRTVLCAAAAQGNVEVVRQLLDRGLDENHRDNSGWTPLHYAAFEGHIEVCEALLEAGAKVDEADNEGKGALLLAAQEGHTALVEILVDRWGAPIEQRAHDGKTALRLAALEGHFDTVNMLYRRGADVDALDADRRSTLYVLALDNRLCMCRHLIVECGASVTNTDTEGRTPLHVSAWQGHTDMVNLLIKIGGAAVDGRDRCRRTALHAAAWRGRTLALRALLAHGADPAAVCTQGATPLGIAAQEGHEECVVWLLQHGADPLQADHAGRTPAKVAWRAGHHNICRLLERWAAAPSAPPHAELAPRPHRTSSPDHKRRSVHSSNSTKSSSNLSHDPPDLQPDLMPTQDKPNRSNLSLSFAQQVARVGRGRRDKDRDSAILEHQVLEDSKLRSYAANERDADIRGYAIDRDRRREERHGYVCDRDNMSPLYASPPRSPVSDILINAHSGLGSQPASLSNVQSLTETDTHFNRDTHMRIILGRETKQQDKADSKNKRNGIVTNPAMRLVANVRNGLDSAAANIRRTGVAIAASASSANPVVKTNAFQWRKETPL